MTPGREARTPSGDPFGRTNGGYSGPGLRQGRNDNSALREFARVLKRRRLVVIICLLLVPAAALVWSLSQEKEYESTSALLFRTAALDQSLPGSSLLSNSEDPTRAAETNVNLVSLGKISERTANAVDEPGVTAAYVADSVSVSLKGESEIADVNVTTTDPDLSAKIANAFAGAYVTFSKEADRNRVLAAQTQVEERINVLTPEERQSEEGRELEQQARQLGVLASLQTGDAEVVQQATPNTSPVAPQTKRNVALGVALGLLVGIGLAFLLDQIDTRIKDDSVIEQIYDLPILARVPQVPDFEPTEGDPTKLPIPLAESFQMLNANLRYFNFHRKLDSVLVTSTAPQEGKSSVAWGLALTAARSGKLVLLIESDLRQPTLSKRLRETPKSGLSLILAGIDSLEDAIVSVPVGEGTPDLKVLPAGPIPPNPTALLESPVLAALLEEARAQYDFVIIDAPPILVADSIPLMPQVSGVVVVSRLKTTRIEAAQEMRELLTHVGATPLGIVVNGSAVPREGYYMPHSGAARASA
ncbi:MAG: polysaccharide biosynthesis tyrosine autokinase [Solirubrobacterales bacterium]